MTFPSPDWARFETVRAEWQATIARPAPDFDRFEAVQREARDLINAGLWASGPGDMLSVIGRQRDELTHSRLIGWLLVPTNRHGLGRRFLRAFLDHLWPGEDLMASGTVSLEIEATGSGLDETGRPRDARADIVLRCDGVAVVIDNKLDAGEQLDQCERLYWAWAGNPEETRWVFLTPTGRAPVTVTSAAATAAWRPMGYGDMRALVATVLDGSGDDPSAGRSTAKQYLATLVRTVA